jgi:hypothetical protein
METFQYQVGFEVLTAVSMKMAVFWVVAQCSLVEVYQRFRGPCSLHHQGDESLMITHRSLIALMMEAARTSETSTRLHCATTQKTVIFISIPPSFREMGLPGRVLGGSYKLDSPLPPLPVNFANTVLDVTCGNRSVFQ